MFRLVTLVRQPDETPTAFVERLQGKLHAHGGPDHTHVYRCLDVTEEDLRPLVEFLMLSGQQPHCQWLRVEHESTTTGHELWLGWSEPVVTQMMEHVLNDLGDIDLDRTQLH
jgi:hypothetical protein